MVFGKQVTVREVDMDRYGRTVAEVILPDGSNLNREMVERDMAWYYREYAPGDVILNRAEVCAKRVKLGRWSQPNPTPPWDWRKGKGVPGTAELIGNRRSHLYHAPSCRGAVATSEKNRVAFATRKEAKAAGYRKAGDCK